MKKQIKMQGIYETRIYTEDVPDGTLEIRIQTQTHDREDKKSLMNLWVKNGWLPEFMPETLSVETLFKDSEGNVWKIYNPTVNSCSTGSEINFDWMLAPTEENEQRIVEEAVRMARGEVPEKGDYRRWPLTDAVVEALEDDDWKVQVCEFDADTGSCLLELERYTEETEYDYIGSFDMRCRDVSDPRAWREEAHELFEAFDPERETALWFGAAGAPSMRAMLDDFDAFKSKVLSRLPEVVARAVVAPTM